MADSPAIVAKRTALARKIGYEMSQASRTRRASSANAAFLRGNGLVGEANRAEAVAKGTFNTSKKRIMAEMGKTFG